MLKNGGIGGGAAVVGLREVGIEGNGTVCVCYCIAIRFKLDVRLARGSVHGRVQHGGSLPELDL